MQNKMYKKLRIFCIIILCSVLCCKTDNKVKKLINGRKCNILDYEKKLYFCIEYDSLGNLYRTGNFIKTKAIGVHKFYKNSKVECLREYVLLKDSSSFLNQIYRISETGDTILSQSNFLEVNNINNPIFVKDSVKIEIILKAPYFSKNFIEGYFSVPDDSSKTRIIEGKDNKISYLAIAKNPGKIIIAGTLVEFDQNDSLNIGTTNQLVV